MEDYEDNSDRDDAYEENLYNDCVRDTVFPPPSDDDSEDEYGK
jgi:hypothetical protein